MQALTEVESGEEDVQFLTLVSPTKGVTVRVSPPFAFDGGPQCGNLLAVSSAWGWAVVGVSGGFSLFSLDALRQLVSTATPSTTPELAHHLQVPTSSPVDFLRLAMGDKIVLAGMRDGTVAVYRLKHLVEGNSSPMTVFPSAGSHLLDVLPNPAPASPLVVLLTPMSLTVVDLETQSAVSTFPPQLQATSACWSVKGKQIAVGTRGGMIAQFTPEGEVKAEIGLPTGIAGEAWEVRSLHWLENNVFLATYARPSAPSPEPTHDYEVYIINKGVGGAIEYVRFMDPTPAFGLMERQGRRWIARFKGWEPFKHLIFMANAPCADIGIFGQSTQWASLNVPESSRPSLPSSLTDSACPLGLEIDLASSDPTYIGGGDERVAGPPSPSLIVYTSEGVLVVWRIVNEMGGAYEGIRPSRDVLTMEDVPESALAPPAFASPVPAASPFGTPATSAFGAPAFATGSAAPAFGSTAFGGGGGTPAFGASAFGTPAFGASAFGSTPSAFGSSATPSAFGSPSTPAAPSGGGFASFGAATPSSFGASAFGAAAAPASPAVAPVAGGFGSFAAATPAGFGASAFGAVPTTASPTVPPATGGFGSFGAATPSGFGSSSAFPTSSSSSGFGSGSALGAAPTFGVSSTPTSFGGSSVTPVAFGTPAATTGGFAGFGGAASAGGFGGFGGAAPSAFGGAAVATPSAFGASAPSAFGSSTSFGSSTTSAFGAPATSAFGASTTSAFGTPAASAFGAAAAPSTSTSTSTWSSFGASATPAVFGSTSTPTVTPSSAKFGAFAASSNRGGNDSDSDVEEELVDEDDRRVDEPPDLEPTVSGLDIGASMAQAKSSIELREEKKNAAASPSSSAFGAGGLSLGNLGFGSPAAASPAAAPVSIFGAATATTAAAGTTPTTFGGFSKVTPPSTGFSFGAAPKVASPPIVVPVTIASPPVVTPTIATPPPIVSAFPKPEAVPTPPPALPISALDSTLKPALPIATPPAKSTPKGLFGFSSSPPSSSASPSLLSRLGPPTEDADEDEEYSQAELEGHDVGEGVYGDDGEEGSEGESELTEQSGSEVEEGPEEDEPDQGEPEEEEEREEEEDEVTSPSPATTLAPSPFSFSSAPSPFSPPAASSSAPSPFSFSAPPTVAAPVPIVAPIPTPVVAKPFFGFTSSAPRSSSPLAGPAVEAPTTAPVPPMFSFKTPVPTPVATPSPAFSLAPTPVAPTPLATVSPVAPPNLTPPPAPAPAVTVRIEEPQPVEEVIPPRQPMSTMTTPKLSQLPSSAATVVVKEQGMSGEFLKAYLTLENEFALLKKNTAVCQTFLKSVGTPYQSTLEPDQSWSMGDLPKLRDLTNKVAPDMGALVEVALGQKREAAELQSLMLKAETKREEAARFIRARCDPVFAKMVRVRQLGPEQVENQKKIRVAVETTRSKIEQLEEHMRTLKDKVIEEKVGRSSFKTPPLDAVNRSVRNITAAVKERTLELDDLALRLDLLRVAKAPTPLTSTPTRLRQRTASDNDDLGKSTLAASPALNMSRSAPPNPDATRLAQAAVRSSRSLAVLKAAMLNVRKAPLLNVMAKESSDGKGGEGVADLQLAFSRGPVTGDRLPTPRRPVPPAPKPVLVAPAPMFQPRVFTPPPTVFNPPPASVALPSGTGPSTVDVDERPTVAAPTVPRSESVPTTIDPPIALRFTPSPVVAPTSTPAATFTFAPVPIVAPTPIVVPPPTFTFAPKPTIAPTPVVAPTPIVQPTPLRPVQLTADNLLAHTVLPVANPAANTTFSFTPPPVSTPTPPSPFAFSIPATPTASIPLSFMAPLAIPSSAWSLPTPPPSSNPGFSLFKANAPSFSFSKPSITSTTPSASPEGTRSRGAPVKTSRHHQMAVQIHARESGSRETMTIGASTFDWGMMDKLGTDGGRGKKVEGFVSAFEANEDDADADEEEGGDQGEDDRGGDVGEEGVKGYVIDEEEEDKEGDGEENEGEDEDGDSEDGDLVGDGDEEEADEGEMNSRWASEPEDEEEEGLESIDEGEEENE